MRLLQLARASRATFAAREKYHRLRLKELEIMRSMGIDDCEESGTLLKESVQQLGDMKSAANKEGLGFLSRASGLFPEMENFSDVESASDDDSDHACRSAPPKHNICSPSVSSSSSQASKLDDV